ncbi:cell division control protein 48 homolog C-like isoform X1 [Trifolium pratense]|nr:cell division control protein 48 homolog C-like isoform X1 [Trifolium pratense]
MGRRFQQQTLLPRIDSCKSKFSTADEIVHYLRSTYPDYHRVKSQTLLYYVNIALLSSNNNNNKPAAREQIDQTASQLTKLSLSENNGGGDAGGGNDVKNVKKVENVVKNVVKRPMFKDLGGNGMEKIKNELEAPLMLVCQPKLCREFGLKPITGILLHGPPGCGKTRLAHAIANEAELPFYPISATQVVTGVAGESENNIRELFSKAKKTAPSIIFIDEIDAIAKRGENSQRQMETRIVTQLLTCMDEACSSSGSSDEPTGYVLVIGATNRLDAIDSALRRPGRFALEIDVGIPDESAREAILFLHTRNCSDKLDSSVDLQKIARSTPGFVGADLEALVGKAGERALDRIIDERKHELSKDLMSETNAGRWKKPWLPQEINRFTIKMTDFEEAVKMAQPSLTREGFSPVPDVKWEDVGALDHVREEFDQHIVKRIKNPDVYEGLGLDRDTGFLLYGPPGCGKTLIAKAVANEAGANFIYIKGPELLNKFVGESEREVRKLFYRARACAPCILFFDEVDAMTTTEHGNEGGRVIDGIRKQLQIELDGAEQRKGVFVIGATNRYLWFFISILRLFILLHILLCSLSFSFSRPEVIDSALLRPGRFGNHIYIPVPSTDGRVSILKALAMHKEALARRMENRARFKLMRIDASVDLSSIARLKACENFSGADLAALMDKAILAALEEKLTTTEKKSDTLTVESRHFEVALSKVSPSVSEKQMEYYEDISKLLKAA